MPGVQSPTTVKPANLPSAELPRKVLSGNQVLTVAAQVDLPKDGGHVTIHVHGKSQRTDVLPDMPDAPAIKQNDIHVGGGFARQPERPPVRRTCADNSLVCVATSTVMGGLAGLATVGVGVLYNDKEVVAAGLWTLVGTAGAVGLEGLAYIGYKIYHG